MAQGAGRKLTVQILLTHGLLSWEQLSSFLISILGPLKHPVKEHYKILCLCSLLRTLLPSLLNVLNLELQIPHIHLFSKYLLSTFRVPVIVGQVLQRAQFLL